MSTRKPSLTERLRSQLGGTSRSPGNLAAVAEQLTAARLAGPLGEIGAGVMASLVTLSNCLSYAALIFSGGLSGGLSQGLWAFVAGAAISCLVLARASSIGPAIGGPRNPPIAVASVLAAGVGAQAMAAGSSTATAVNHVLVTLAIATLATGLAMYAIGRLRIGGALRFVPAPVIAGFLAASGWFLAIGSVGVALGRPLGMGSFAHGVSAAEAHRLLVAAGFVGLIHLANRIKPAATTLPLVFVAFAAGLGVLLHLLGIRAGWYLEIAVGASPWSPLQPSRLDGIDWDLIARSGIEIASVAGVAVIGLLLDAATLEAQRGRTSDMDSEYRENGRANLIAAPLGGVVAGLAPNASRMLDQLGARSPLSGLAAGLLLGGIAVSGFDVTEFVPTPVLAGLLLFLGLGVMSDALQQARSQGSRTDLVLALAIALVIAWLGYLAGIVLGLVAATLTFAIRYSRIDVIRRHATRAAVAAPVERAPDLAALLSREGHRIHVFWLAGYIFFGSSNRVIEDIQRITGTGSAAARRWIILDLAGLNGIDTTGTLAFRKLDRWARANHVSIGLASVPAGLHGRFEGWGTGSSVLSFASRQHGLSWAEQDLIRESGIESGRDPEATFSNWLDRELGPTLGRRLLETYLSRRDLALGETVCAQGEIADTIDLVADGTLAITVNDMQGRTITVRRTMGCTVIGEMGFVRNGDRTASVIAETPTRLYTLTRWRYDEMRRNDPALAAAYLEFLMRQLADRLEFATKEISALT